MQTCRINAFTRSFISRVCGFGGTQRMKRPIRASETSALGQYNQTSIQREYILRRRVLCSLSIASHQNRAKTVPTSRRSLCRALSLSLSALLGSHAKTFLAPDRQTDALPFVRVKYACVIQALSVL